jgi:Mn2+/Fe2+ NRAMP family transporter
VAPEEEKSLGGNSLETAFNLPVLAAQIINWLILAVIIAVSIYFVGWDSRKRQMSWPETVAWVVVSVATFPIGFGLYFLLRKRTSAEQKT